MQIGADRTWAIDVRRLSTVFIDLRITDVFTDKHRQYAQSVVIPVAPKAADGMS
jgi:hypothetical protein